MSNETDKPLAGAIKGATAVGLPSGYAAIIARESGLAELVEAVERANVVDHRGTFPMVKMRLKDWQRISAAARRVRGVMIKQVGPMTPAEYIIRYDPQAKVWTILCLPWNVMSQGRTPEEALTAGISAVLLSRKPKEGRDGA